MPAVIKLLWCNRRPATASSRRVRADEWLGCQRDRGKGYAVRNWSAEPAHLDRSQRRKRRTFDWQARSDLWLRYPYRRVGRPSAASVAPPGSLRLQRRTAKRRPLVGRPTMSR